jgi:transposase
MFKVELYGRVRRAVLVDGVSQRSVAREFGISRKPVRKMVSFSVPPGYRREQPIRRPKRGPWIGVIGAILDEDKQRSAKQRHTAKRIFDRLREEHQFSGGYTIVKDYVRGQQLRAREMFVPLTHAPGGAQADFGEALAVVGRVECKAHYLAMDLPHSDGCFVLAFPAETAEAFLEGHFRAFAYFGGVPTRILYGNTKIAVAKILSGTGRQRARGRSLNFRAIIFSPTSSGVRPRATTRARWRGWWVYARRSFMVPVPCFATWEAFNAHLEAECRKRRERKLRGHSIRPRRFKAGSCRRASPRCAACSKQG